MKKKVISGIMVTMFLVTIVTFAIPVRVSAYTGDPFYVGIVGPKGWIQWDGIKEGAQLAADLINTAGGMVDGGGGTHEVILVEIDEHAVPVPDPTAAVAELLSALDTYPDMQFLVGGFRSECVFPMREAAMDYAAVNDRPIWIINGAATDEIIDDGPDDDNPFDDVREDYERYKYMFRSNPMNSTTVGNQLFYMVAQLIVPKLSVLFAGGGAVPAYIIAEDLIWNEGIVELIYEYAPIMGMNIVGEGRPSAIETDFGPFLDAVEDSGAKLLIYLFSAVAGATFIRQWGERKVPVVPVGINVESMMQEFYASIGGKCEYETIMSSVGTKTNVNPNAKPLNPAEFWDEYELRYGHAPVYTAWGAYDTIIAMNETFAQSWGQSSSYIITNVLETIERPNALLGRFKYTKYHDVYVEPFANTPIMPPAGWPSPVAAIGTTRAMLPQWQAGNLEVIWPRGYYPAPGSALPSFMEDGTPLPFARKWKFPPWVYSLGETDIAGGGESGFPPFPVGDTPEGYLGWIPLPDGVVGPADMGSVTALWQQTVPWNNLEADMDGNQFIDIDDVARVALDWGKTA